MKNKCNATTCSNLEISESAFKRWLKNDNQFKRDYEKIKLIKDNLLIEIEAIAVAN